MVKCLTYALRGLNGAVQRRLATLTVTMLVSSCWQLSSEVELRRIFDVCKRWANSGSHEFVTKYMVRYVRPHGRFAHGSCRNALAVRQLPFLASCIEIYYYLINVDFETITGVFDWKTQGKKLHNQRTHKFIIIFTSEFVYKKYPAQLFILIIIFYILIMTQ